MSFAKEDKLGALWIRTSSKGTPFLSGKIGDQQVVVFKVQKKVPRGPDYEIFKSTPREAPVDPNPQPSEVPW